MPTPHSEKIGQSTECATPSGDPIAHAIEQAHSMLAEGAPRQQVLARLTVAGEALAGGGATVSILVLDKDGLLRNGASPNLPSDYLRAIDRLKPNPNLGTCAAAAATGCVVITRDFLDDEKWAELRHLPLALGFLGAWSMPIKSAVGTVLGTFGTYYRTQREPTPQERAGVERLAATAANVLAAG
jgi:GAF domain-containing protein